MEKKTLGFALCGSFCTYRAVLSALEALQVRSGRDRPAVLSDGVKDPDGLTGEG